MRGSPMIQTRRVALIAFFAALLLKPAVVLSEGLVQYQLEMGGFSRQKYQCVFVGSVIVNGKACAGAHISAELADAQGEVITERVDADETGRYELHLTVDGRPQSATQWKLTAKAAVMGAIPSEVEGRLILTDDLAVRIDRTIQLAEGA